MNPHPLPRLLAGLLTAMAALSTPAAWAQTVNSVETIVGDMTGDPDVAQDRTGFFLDPVRHTRRFGAWPLPGMLIPNSAAIRYLVDNQRTQAQVTSTINAATGKPMVYLGKLLWERTSSDGTARGWNNVVGWTWIHPGRDNRATNTAVELRHAEVYVLRASTGQWVRLIGDPDPIPADAPHKLVVARQANGSLKVSWTNRGTGQWLYAQGSVAPLTGGDAVFKPALQPDLPQGATSYTIPASAVQPGIYRFRVFYGAQARLPQWAEYRINDDGSLETIANAAIEYPHGQQWNLACKPEECLPMLEGAGETPLADGKTVRVQPRMLPNGSALSYELWNTPCGFCNSTDNPGFPDIHGDVKAIFATVQARLVSIDPDPAKDDRAKARMYIEQGYDIYQMGDFGTFVGSDGKEFPRWMLTQFDGGVSRYKMVTTEWQAFNVATVTNNHPEIAKRRPEMSSGRNVRYVAPYRYEQDVVDPDGGWVDWNYGLGSPFNNTTHLLTADQLRANPPPLR